VRFHNVPIDLIQAQADALGIPLLRYGYTPASFEGVFRQALGDLRQRDMTTIIFGDIHLVDVRGWYEERTTAAGLIHREPLWGDDPGQLVRECIDRHYQATITCIELERAKPEWLGATLTEELVREFELAGIDVCGERGEYHTFVIAGPLFSQEVPVKLGEEVTDGRFKVLDIALGESYSLGGISWHSFQRVFCGGQRPLHIRSRVRSEMMGVVSRSGIASARRLVRFATMRAVK